MYQWMLVSHEGHEARVHPCTRVRLEQYPPYDHNLNSALVTIHILYIPIIIVASIFVISAVILIKKLHNPHNVLLLAVSASDLLVALIVIPIRLMQEIAVTRRMICSYKYFYPGLDMSADACEVIVLYILVILGLDTLTQITFPLKYRRHVSTRKVISCIITIAILNVSIYATLFGLTISTIDDKEVHTIIHKVAQFYSMITAGSLLILCIFIGICVRYKRWRLGNGTTGRETTWLLTDFIIFYIPTLLFVLGTFGDMYTKELLLQNVARIIRHLTSATNGILIYNFRPSYKFAFQYFLKTNPKNWNTVALSLKKESFRRKMSRLSGKKTKLEVYDTPESSLTDPQPVETSNCPNENICGSIEKVNQASNRPSPTYTVAADSGDIAPRNSKSIFDNKQSSNSQTRHCNVM